MEMRDRCRRNQLKREFTLVGVNPALDQFADVAAEMKKAAHEAAADAGKALAAS